MYALQKDSKLPLDHHTIAWCCSASDIEDHAMAHITLVALLALAVPLGAQAQISVKDVPYNAEGDTHMISVPATLAAGSRILMLSTAAGRNGFTSVDVGKVIGIAGVGAAPTTGYITAIAVTNSGAGYTSLPTIYQSQAALLRLPQLLQVASWTGRTADGGSKRNSWLHSVVGRL
jgi:hypothetical protein